MHVFPLHHKKQSDALPISSRKFESHTTLLLQRAAYEKPALFEIRAAIFVINFSNDLIKVSHLIYFQMRPVFM